MSTFNRLFVGWALASHAVAGCGSAVPPTPAPLPLHERPPARANWNYGPEFSDPLPGWVTVSFDSHYGVKPRADHLRVIASDREVEAMVNQILETYDVRTVSNLNQFFSLTFTPDTDTQKVVAAFRSLMAVNTAYRQPKIIPAGLQD